MTEKTPREQIALLKNVIEDLQERVQTASESIRAIVQTLDEQHDEAAQPDFERLRYESEKQAYEGHPAARSTMPELYFLLLVSVLTAADATQAQWRHLYRTAAGAGYEADVRDLLPDAYSLTDAKLIEAVDSIEHDELVNAFVLDSLLLALLHEGDAAALLAYIADLFALLGAEKGVVSETMQAAKTIVAQDREAYLAMMADMEHIYEYERCCYLFPLHKLAVRRDLTQSDTIASEHLLIFGVEASNEYLNLDDWEAKKVTFRDCIFKNSVITASQKEVHFIKCTFYDENDDTEHTWLRLEKENSFTKCTFKKITNEDWYLLRLSNTKIAHCTFSDCSIHSCNLLNLSNSTITDSEIIRCHCTNKYPILYMTQTNVVRCNISNCSRPDGPLLYLEYGTITDSEFGHCKSDNSYTLFDVMETTVMRCNFSYCEINCDNDYFTSILQATDSIIKDCHFKQCRVKTINGVLRFIFRRGSTEKTNSIYQDCSFYNKNSHRWDKQ